MNRKLVILSACFLVMFVAAMFPHSVAALPSADARSESTTVTVTRTVESYVLESDHPYSNYFDYTWTITKEGATQIRVHFTKIDVETNYDYVYVYDYAGNTLHSLTGLYSTGGWTSYSYGDTIKIRLKTDYSVTDWGFAIDQIDYETGGGGSTTNELTSGQTVTSSLSATGDTEMWTIQVDANCLSMHSVLTCGSNDYDLYGRLGAEPTTSTYDWRGYTSGGEDVTYDNPGAGTWYIMVRSYSGSGQYDLTVTLTYDTGGGGTTNELTSGETVSSSLSGTSDTEMWTIQVDANCLSMHSVLTCGSNDYDLYGRLGAEPTTSVYDWRGYTTGGEDVTYDNPAAGTWYIMVRSYSGSGPYDLTVTLTYDTGGGGGTGDGVVHKWAVIVGISDYEVISDLTYCDEDVTDWYNYLTNVMGYDYIRVLGDTHETNYPAYYALATEYNVKAALNWLAGADADDEVAFITSGHGSGDGYGSSYLCMWDCNSGESGEDGNLYDTELAAIVGTWVAARIFIFVDHCYSGGLIPEIQALSNSAHVYMTTTCTENGYGYDDSTHQNGAWTYYFLEYGLINHFGSNPDTLMEDCFDYALAAYPHSGGDTPQEFDGDTNTGFTL
ncbi:MAG: pre-peptidase C-terminal domain-containing protein [Candidatus Thorarchaeota archaeon]